MMHPVLSFSCAKCYDARNTRALQVREVLCLIPAVNFFPRWLHAE